MEKQNEPISPPVEARQEGQSAAPPQPQVDPVEAMRAERDDAIARLQRVAADYQNYQKRMARQQVETRQFARVEMMKTLVPILDDFERCLEAARTAESLEKVVEGIQLVFQHLQQALRSHDLETIESLGKPFDPELHEAMMEKETADVRPRTVVHEFARGYRLNDRVLRPAKVIVSKLPGPQAKPSDSERPAGTVE